MVNQSPLARAPHSPRLAEGLKQNRHDSDSRNDGGATAYLNGQPTKVDQRKHDKPDDQSNDSENHAETLFGTNVPLVPTQSSETPEAFEIAGLPSFQWGGVA